MNVWQRATRLICRLSGHQTVPVTKVVHPGGICTFAARDPNGDRLACRRCRHVLPKETP